MGPQQNDWELSATHAVASKFKKYAKKHPDEYASCFENLDRVIQYLRRGYKWKSFQFGYLRPEGECLYRIGETGVSHAKGTRLYIYVPDTGSMIYLISIGDKDTQENDIKEAKSIIRAIKREQQNEQENGNGKAGG